MAPLGCSLVGAEWDKKGFPQLVLFTWTFIHSFMHSLTRSFSKAIVPGHAYLPGTIIHKGGAKVPEIVKEGEEISVVIKAYGYPRLPSLKKSPNGKLFSSPKQL